MIRKLSLGGIAALGVAATLAAAAPARADDAFKGKQITVIIGYGMGGTYGLYAQILARHLPAHIAGQPTAIVQSMVGAGGIKATNYAYNVAAKDGTVWLMPPDSLVISNILERDKVKYAADKFQFLGTVTQSNAVVAVRADKGVRTVDDAKKTEVIVGSTGTGSQTFQIPALANAVLGTKFKIVMGYKGSLEVFQAMERKEADATSVTWQAWSTSRAQWVKDGYVIPLLQVGVKKDPAIPNVPMVIDLVKSPEDRQIVNFMSSLGPVGRSLAVPPGVPADRVTALRAAFDATMKDPAFLDDMKKRKFDVTPLTGTELQDIVVDMMKVPDDVAASAKKRIMQSAGKAG